MDAWGRPLFHPPGLGDHIENGIGLTGQVIESGPFHRADHCHLPATVLPHEEIHRWVIHVVGFKPAVDLCSQPFFVPPASLYPPDKGEINHPITRHPHRGNVLHLIHPRDRNLQQIARADRVVKLL